MDIFFQSIIGVYTLIFFTFGFVDYNEIYQNLFLIYFAKIIKIKHPSKTKATVAKTSQKMHIRMITPIIFQIRFGTR